jgi:peptidoglycan/LPS O-acetylase OafA/YrhL
MWLALDLLLVSLFAAVGRLSHDDSLTVAGWWTTAWPFLAGTLLAWAALAAARRPPAAVTSGLVVWAGALVGGMVLRQASGQGTATAFVVVATLVLGAFLVLPRIATSIGASIGTRVGVRDRR